MTPAGYLTLAGCTIEEAGLRSLVGVYLMEIDRQGEVMAAVPPDTRLQAGDRLVFVGVVGSVTDLRNIRGLVPATDQVFRLGGARAQRCLVEAVVSDSCPLVGRSIREGRFRSHYGAAVVAAAGLMLATRCCSVAAARHAVVAVGAVQRQEGLQVGPCALVPVHNLGELIVPGKFPELIGLVVTFRQSISAVSRK